MKYRRGGGTHEIQAQQEKPGGRKHLEQNHSEFFRKAMTEPQESTVFSAYSKRIVSWNQE